MSASSLFTSSLSLYSEVKNFETLKRVQTKQNRQKDVRQSYIILIFIAKR